MSTLKAVILASLVFCIGMVLILGQVHGNKLQTHLRDKHCLMYMNPDDVHKPLPSDRTRYTDGDNTYTCEVSK
jgi:hypothetical protein